MTLEAGMRVGKYEVKQLLGAGGMGEVYLAQDTELGRAAALKILPADMAEDRQRMNRFTQEARAASALNHPNILTIYDVGHEGPLHFIAAEFIEGETLQQLSKTRRLSVGEVLDVAAQVADALAAAHEAGIVHRDVKPENVMVRRRDGYVKVLDFGLAKLTELVPAEIDSKAVTRPLVKTTPSTVMGTVAYMSPEQARGLETDARTDIWSLGVVLYELLAGRPPFTGVTKTDIILAIVDKEPAPLRVFAPEAPEALEWVVTKALTKEKEERYQTAREMLGDLRRLKQRLDAGAEIERLGVPHVPDATPFSQGESASGGAPAVAGPAEATRISTVLSAEYVSAQIKRHKLAASFAVVAATVLVAGAAFAFYRMVNWRDTTPREMKVERLTDTGKAGAVAISPDGKQVVHVVEDAGQQSLWLRHVATGSTMQIIPPAEVEYWRMTFSPDGGYIYFTRRPLGTQAYTLYSMPVLGGEQKEIVSGVDSPVTFSPDGQRMAFVRWQPMKVDESDLIIANVDGTNERLLARSKATEKGIFTNNGPAWSPDEREIVVEMRRMKASGGPYDDFPAVVSVADGSFKPIRGAQQWDDVRRVGWLADGSAIVAVCQEEGKPVTQLYLISYPDGAVRHITNDTNNYDDLSLTADTATIATVKKEADFNIWVAPAADARSLRQLTYGGGKREGESGVRRMPDGRIVYEAYVNGSWDIWIMNGDGSEQRRLTSNQGNFNAEPAVSPNGRYVVFVSNRAGTQNLWRVDTNGANAKQLTSTAALVSSPAFTHDGKWVLYEAQDGEHRDLFKVSIEGGESVRLTEGFLAATPRASPDGKWIAAYYRARADAPWMFAILSPDGGQPVKLLDVSQTAGYFFWLPDSRALAYVDTQKGVSNIWAHPIAGGKPRQLTDFTSGKISDFDLSPDGRPTLFSRGETRRDVVLIKDFR